MKWLAFALTGVVWALIARLGRVAAEGPLIEGEGLIVAVFGAMVGLMAYGLNRFVRDLYGYRMKRRAGHAAQAVSAVAIGSAMQRTLKRAFAVIKT